MHLTILARLARVLTVALGATAAAGLAFALAFALAGAASADHDEATHFQAESMAHGPFAAAVPDPSAFGGKALRYADPGRATRSVTLPTEGERVVVRARNGAESGSRSRSAVGLRVLVDGEAVGEKLISSTSYAYHSFDAAVPEGTRKVSVEAYSLSGKDRAYLDAVRVVHRDPPPDADADGVTDASDNCPGATNADQKDADGDGTGDACDPQDDRPPDADGDGISDAEDPDRDGDGFANGVDNRPDTHNPGQPDIDGDKVGDFADPDKDGDGIANHQDPAPKERTIPAQGGGLPADCGRTIAPGQDLDQIVNSDPSATATKFCLSASTTPYSVDNTVLLRNGDVLTGPVGQQTTRGPAVYGTPQARIDGAGVDKVVSLNGTSELHWVEVTGADGRIDPTRAHSTCPSTPLPEGQGCPVVGTGVGIAMGQASGNAKVSNVYAHANDSNGISNAVGRIKNSHFTDNTRMSAFLGVTASAVKGVREFELANSYIHDEQGIGAWHDHALSGEGNVPEMSTNPGGGTWVHDNLIVNNTRYGIRFEYSPRDAGEGQHLATPTFLAERNRVAGTRTNAGASHHDAQNGTWRSNIFGPQTVAGVAYPGNFNNKALVIRDSGRTDRTDTWNAVVTGNTLGGEIVEGCAVANTVCSGNS